MSYEYTFVDPLFENEIKNKVIPSVFPSLNIPDVELLSKYIIRLINVMSICFGMYQTDDIYADRADDYDYVDTTRGKEIYIDQLRQNNYQDIKWLLCHLLPFINEANDPTKIVSLSELYTKKKQNIDINISEPKYLYSNIQYNRFKRESDSYTERPYNVNDLNHNFYLLLNTIKLMSNKMHVNWLDILPYTLKNYKNTNLFVRTKEALTKKTGLLKDWDPFIDANLSLGENEACQNIAGINYGLHISDIYNTLSIDLFNGIKDIKWLLYDVQMGNKLYPTIVVMGYLFKLNFCLANISWSNMTKNDRDEFNDIWTSLIDAAKIGVNIAFGTIINLSNISIKKMLRGIILSFDKRSVLKKNAQNDGYIPINITKSEDKIITISFSDVLISLESLDTKYIYEFLIESLQKFKTTWYGTKILSEDKKNIALPFKHYYMNKNIPLTYKNIYNFSKSLTHFVDKEKKYSSYPEHWTSLNDNETKEILKRLNKGYTDHMEWFNISRNIRFLNLTTLCGDCDVSVVNGIIYESITTKLPNIIFESLITKGVLTRFIPAKQKTNQKYLPRDDIYKVQHDVLNTSPNNPYWTSAYHYLTGLPYKSMDKFQTIDDPENNHFKFGSKKGQTWYTAYSYDWIAQIGFCHHFLNNRVIFITGSTGVGKSTEIPKIFLYYTRALDYNPCPKIVCTQPRKAPTENNADFVSKTLGVPISEFNGKRGQKTNNYYIQMKHRDSDHTQNVKHGMLKYVTDGSLILEINDPILKVTKATLSKKKEEEKKMYKSDNIYDIIMIDEAHEHKLNMDLLLTLLKYSATYNNSIRLVILSATMDDDEAKYRRFYRDINDNRKYPLDKWIQKHSIDRINVDRRFHISPPGMGTRYKVEDIYEPKKTEIEMILEIIKKSDSGDILLFEPGVGEITKLITELNPLLPPDVIALPYHGQLSKDSREFIEKIADRLHLLRISKDQNFATTQDLTVGKSRYKRAIIVATNAAEASITIASLKFVVETGNQKVELYDYKRRGEKLIKTDISESSRIQRRGRVGRKSSGKVYYLYEIGKMENNVIAYEIATKDLYMDIFKKLKKSENENLVLDIDPNAKSTKLEYKTLNKIFGRNGLDEMIGSQYFTGSTYYDYWGNDEFYDYDNYKKLEPYYDTGLSFRTLTDNTGTFYAIHPDELMLKRNIGGDIVGTTDGDGIKFIKLKKYSGMIFSRKMKSFWQVLLDYLYISFSANKLDIVKTELGEQLIRLFEDFKMDSHNLFRSLIFGIANGCGEDMIRLNSICKIIKFDPTKLLAGKDTMVDKSILMGTMLKSTSKKDSDVRIILDILNSFHLFLETIGVSEKLNSSVYITKLGELTDYGYTREDYYNLLGPEDVNSQSLKKKLIDTTKNKFVIVLMEILNDHFEYSLIKNKSKILEWCKNRMIDSDIIIKYIKEYVNMRAFLTRKLTSNTLQFLKYIQKTFSLSSREDRHIDPLDLSLLFGFPFNVCRRMPESSYYLSVYSPNFDNFYQISSYSQFKYKMASCVSTENLQEYLLYLTINIETDSILCLHKVGPELITVLGHIYNAKHFTKHNSDPEGMQQIIKSKMKKYDETKILSAIGPDLANAIVNYTKTLELMNRECKIYFDDNTLQFV